MVAYKMFSLLRKAFSCLSVMDSAGVGSSLIQHCIIPLQHIHISISTNYVYTGTKVIYTYYLEYHSVCPLVEIGTPPPLSRKRVCHPPPEPKGGGGTHAPAGEGMGGPNSDDWRKSLALCLVCVCTVHGIENNSIFSQYIYYLHYVHEKNM